MPTAVAEQQKIVVQKWAGTKGRFDLAQLLRSVPKAVRAWAQGRAKKAKREVSKADLKLPFREPDGRINLNAVRAALAALGGARGGVDLPQRVQAAARRELSAIMAKVQPGKRGRSGGPASRSPTPPGIGGPGPGSTAAEAKWLPTPEGLYQRQAGGKIQAQIADQIDITTGEVDEGAGVIRGVKIIGAESGNTDFGRKRRYTAEALREAVGLYEGVPVNIDHPLDERGQFAPGRPRSAQDRVGVIERVRHEANGSPENRGDLRLLKTHPMAARLLEAAADRQLSALFSLSHNAIGIGIVEAGEFVIEKIEIVHSVDVVPDGGTNRGLFESSGAHRRPAAEGPIAEKVDKEKREESLRLVNSTAMQMVHEVIYDEDDLPISAKRDRISAILDDWQGEIEALETQADTAESRTAGGEPMKSINDLTLDELKGSRADLIEAIHAEGEDEAQVVTLREENTELKKKLDEATARDALAEKKALVVKLIGEAKLPKELVSEVFVETLEGCEDEAAIKSLIEDRRKLTATPGATKPQSAEGDLLEGQNPAATDTGAAVDSKAAGEAMDSLIGAG